MTLLYYWAALGAAGFALDIVFALFGFGHVYRGMKNQQSMPLKHVLFGMTVGTLFVFLLGPMRIVLTLAGAKEKKS